MQVWETWINYEFFEKDLLLLPDSITLRKNKFQFIVLLCELTVDN